MRRKFCDLCGEEICEEDGGCGSCPPSSPELEDMCRKNPYRDDEHLFVNKKQ